MCGIVAAIYPETFKELVSLNQSRGKFSYSLCTYYIEEGLEIIERGFGPFPLEFTETFKFQKEELWPDYLLGHVQSPTGGLIKDPSRIHPAHEVDRKERGHFRKERGHFLFHNGIIKSAECNRLRDGADSTTQWDTALFLEYLICRGAQFDLEEILSEIDGSFACLYVRGTEILVFRSQAGILYYDAEMSLSSTPFPGSMLLPHDEIFQLDLGKKQLISIGTFKSKSAPYFIA